MHMNSTIALRRSSTPATPRLNRMAESAEGLTEQHHQILRLASTTAPTMATSSRIEVISKGIR